MGLAEAAKNEFLHRLVVSLLGTLREYRERSVREESDRIRSHETHLNILKAVQEGREKEAVAHMIGHLLEIEGGEVGIK